jgi:glycosyltransferase involved in cell wall biosynthesis
VAPAIAFRPLHVLVTVNASWNLLNFRSSLLEALIADGHQVTALASPDACTPRIEAMGCRFLPLRMDSKGLSPNRDLALLVRFLRHFRRERPDVVLGYTIKNNVYGALAARVLGIPFLPNVSGLGTAFLSSAWLQILAKNLYRAAFRSVPVVFFQNADDRALFVQYGLVDPARTHVLPGSGIDLERFAPSPTRKRAGVRFVLIARMLRDKGVVEFVDAARIVRKSNPQAEFHLIGPAGAENRSAIDAWEIEQWVREGIVTYIGPVEDVRPHIAASDCVVLPSYREGAPRSLIEGSAMARPVIATDVPGCRFVVEREVTGLLCEVRNAESLAVQMRRMIALGPEGRMSMGKAARLKMERDWDERHVIAAYRMQLATVARSSLQDGGGGRLRTRDRTDQPVVCGQIGTPP